MTASAQSEIIPTHEWLQEKIQTLKKQYNEKEIPLPALWEGFKVIPFKIEFLEGRIDQLHDRVLYQMDKVD